MSIKADLYIDQATTFSTSINMADENGNPLDLTGYTATSYIKRWFTDTNHVQFSVNTLDSTGVITLSLTAQQTALLVAERYFYDVLLANANQTNITKIAEGLVTVVPTVTQ